jgi:hypothetical protein
VLLVFVAAEASKADIIDFESGFVDQQSLSKVITATNTVSFWTNGAAKAYIVKVGEPITGFLPNDTALGTNHGNFFLTDSAPDEAAS